MTVATITKGERSATNWMVDGEDKPFAVLGMAKKRAEEVGMAKAVSDGFVEAAAPDAKQGDTANPFQKYDDEARTYGFEVRPDGAIGRDGKFPGAKVVEKSGRLRIESGSGKDDGAYLADTYATHARLVQEAVAAGKLDTPQGSNAPSDFIPAPDGGLDYGEITPEMGKAMRRQAGKIRLRRGDETQGLVHIEARHAKDFAALGFESAQHFVAQVAKGFTKIYKGRGAALDVVLDDQARGMLIVSLEPSVDGDFYDIKTATPIRRDQFKNEEPLWERAGPSASTAVEGSPLIPRAKTVVTV